MKLYLTLALVALFLNAGFAKNLPKNRNLKGSASEEVVVQETAVDSDDLTENVVDDNNVVLNNAETLSNTVNLLDTNVVPEVTLVENAPTKTLSKSVSTVNVVSQPLTTRTLVNQLPVQTVSVQSVPTVNVVKSVQSPSVNVVKTVSVPTSKTVVVNQPAQTLQTVSWPQQQTVRYVQSVPQQQVWQQQQVWSPVTVQQQPQSQLVWQQPQTQTVWQQPQQVLVQQPQTQTVWQQPQTQQVLVQQQPQQLLVRKQAPLRTTVWQQPAAVVKTVNTVQRVPNPLVVSLTPSKSVSRQTVLTGSQLVDESSKSDVVVQETESNY